MYFGVNIQFLSKGKIYVRTLHWSAFGTSTALTPVTGRLWIASTALMRATVRLQIFSHFYQLRSASTILTPATGRFWIASTALMRATESRRKLPAALSSMRSKMHQRFWCTPIII